jgi:hypothetical protein
MVGSVGVDVDPVEVGGPCTTSTIPTAWSTPVVQVQVPTMNVRPAASSMEVGKMTIWLAMGFAITPPTWHAIVDEISVAIYRGVCPR